jgi:hypothetical protein
LERRFERRSRTHSRGRNRIGGSAVSSLEER